MALSTRLMSACRSTCLSASASGRGAPLDDDLLLLLLGEHAEVLRHFFGQRLQVHDLARQRRLAGLGARQREQPIDEAGETIDLLEHAFDDAAIGVLVALAAQAHLADAADRRERRAQLVRDVGGELPHLRERRLEPRQRLVEHRGQPAHLVVGMLHRQPIRQPLGGDRPRALGHLLDRRQRPARQRRSRPARPRRPRAAARGAAPAGARAAAPASASSERPTCTMTGRWPM